MRAFRLLLAALTVTMMLPTPVASVHVVDAGPDASAVEDSVFLLDGRGTTCAGTACSPTACAPTCAQFEWTLVSGPPGGAPTTPSWILSGNYPVTAVAVPPAGLCWRPATIAGATPPGPYVNCNPVAAAMSPGSGPASTHATMRVLLPRILEPCPIEGIVLTFELKVTPPSETAIRDYVDITVKRAPHGSAPGSPAIVPQNRCPVADAGPDQVVAESSLVTLHGEQSFDPDTDDELRYCWRFIGDGSADGNLQDSDLTSLVWPSGPSYVTFKPWVGGLATQPPQPLATPGPAPRQPGQNHGFAPAESITEPTSCASFPTPPLDPPYYWQFEERSTPSFYAPMLAPGDPPSIDLWYQLVVNDRGGGNQRLYAVDEIKVTVLNTNQPPHDMLVTEDERRLAIMKQGVIPNTSPPEGCPVACTTDELDLVDERNFNLIFSIPDMPDDPGDPIREDGVLDDRGVKVVEAVLTHATTGQVIHIPLQKVEDTDIGVAGPEDDCPNAVPTPIQPEPLYGPLSTGIEQYPDGYKGMWKSTCENRSFWRAVVSARTPELTKGTYRVTFFAFDGEGGVYEAPVELGDPTVVEPREISIGASPYNKGKPTVGVQDVTALTTAVGNECFPGTTRWPAQFLATGDLMRIDIEMPDINSEDPPEVELVRPLFMLHKVTYQICVGKGAAASIGPEITLRAPYQLSLDNLANGYQEVKVKVTDRANQVSEFVVPVTTDPENPFAVARVPEPTYLDIPFEVRVLVRDDSANEAELGIDDAFLGATGVPTDLRERKDSNHADAAPLPKLTSIERIELTQDGIRDIVGDATGDGVLDGYIDPETLDIVLFDAIDCDDDDRTDFLVDDDGDGACDDDEVVLVGGELGSIEAVLCPRAGGSDIQRAQLCADYDAAATNGDGAVDAMVRSGPTTLYTFDVTRDILGETTYRLTARDAAGNRFQREGTITTVIPVVDTAAVKLEVDATTLPALPGDRVKFLATVGQIGGLFPIAPDLVFGGDLPLVVPAAGPIAPDAEIVYGDVAAEPLSDSFLPGIHTVTLTVLAPEGLAEIDDSDQQAQVTFEVFLGKVLDGTDVYFVRANDNGLPRTDGGARTESGSDAYDLSYNAPAGRYEFQVGNRTLYWDPFEKDANGKPVTVVPPDVPEDDKPKKDTPGLAPLVFLGALAAAMLVQRRRK